MKNKKWSDSDIMLAKGLIAFGAVGVTRDCYYPERVLWGNGVVYSDKNTLPKDAFSALKRGQSVKLIDILESE